MHWYDRVREGYMNRGILKKKLKGQMWNIAFAVQSVYIWDWMSNAGV